MKRRILLNTPLSDWYELVLYDSYYNQILDSIEIQASGQEYNLFKIYKLFSNGTLIPYEEDDLEMGFSDAWINNKWGTSDWVYLNSHEDGWFSITSDSWGKELNKTRTCNFWVCNSDDHCISVYVTQEQNTVKWGYKQEINFSYPELSYEGGTIIPNIDYNIQLLYLSGESEYKTDSAKVTYKLSSNISGITLDTNTGELTADTHTDLLRTISVICHVSLAGYYREVAYSIVQIGTEINTTVTIVQEKGTYTQYTLSINGTEYDVPKDQGKAVTYPIIFSPNEDIILQYNCSEQGSRISEIQIPGSFQSWWKSSYTISWEKIYNSIINTGRFNLDISVWHEGTIEAM